MDLIGARPPPAAEEWRPNALDVPATLSALELLRDQQGRQLDLTLMFERVTQYLAETKACIEECHRLVHDDQKIDVIRRVLQRFVARRRSGELPHSTELDTFFMLRAIRRYNPGLHLLRTALLEVLHHSEIEFSKPDTRPEEARRNELGLYHTIKDMITPDEDDIQRFDISSLERDQDLSDLRALAEAWRELERKRERRLAMAMGTHPRLSNELTSQQVWSFRSLPAELQKHILKTENRWPSSAAARWGPQ